MVAFHRCRIVEKKTRHNIRAPEKKRFHHVRVPRTSLLGGVAEVSPEGKYSRVPGGQKQSYGAMLAVRANIVINASRSLARALTSESFAGLRLYGLWVRFS